MTDSPIRAMDNEQLAQTNTKHRMDATPGLVAALLVFCLYGGLGFSVDFSRAAFGFQSDEATYYLMTYSIVSDGDFAYKREDLVRTYREFPSGPNGIFLKRGRVLQVNVDGSAPFVHVRALPDPDTTELFYGKNYIYPLFSAPFVALFKTNGFLVFHALLLGLILLAGYLFLNARMPPLLALVLSAGFLMASVAPAYLRVDDPRAVQSGARGAGLLLLALQGGRRPRAGAARDQVAARTPV